MAGIPTAEATKLLAAVFTGTAYTSPTTLWVQLHTGDPGAACTSLVAANSTRKQITFAAVSGNQAVSNNAPQWTNVPASETYADVSIWDASTAGNPLWSGPLTVAQAVTAGDTFTLTSGQVTVTLS